MQGYCPLCYKGRIGVSGTSFVRENDGCLDKAQAMLSRRGNGLPVLNMESPGERCENATMCKLLCLVCGKSMLDGDEPDFETLVEVLEELETRQMEFAGEVANCGLEFLARSMEKDMRKKSHRALREYGLAWVESWQKPVHAACSQTAPCECVVPIFVDACAKHGRRIPQRPTRARDVRKPKQKVSVEKEPVTLAPSGAGSSHIQAKITRRATWLPPATDMAITESQVPAPKEARDHGAPSVKRKALAPAAKAKQPYAHTMRGKMIKAASTCRKLDGWAGGGLESMSQDAAASSEARAGGKYDLGRHNSTYDPFVHGPFRKNGQYWFLRPDGKAVRAQEGVCEFTEQGELIPC
jgi:hypothetical protein